jgi:hypothetical protein
LRTLWHVASDVHSEKERRHEVPVNPLRDDADWTGIRFESTDVGATDRFVYRGYAYVNRMELNLAKLLWESGIPFTPDVLFVMDMPPGSRRRKRQFVPDFVFDGKAYVWHGGPKPELIHGIECKGAPSKRFSERALENVRLLKEQRGVRIKLMNHKDIMRCVRRGTLPMTPLLP